MQVRCSGCVTQSCPYIESSPSANGDVIKSQIHAPQLYSVALFLALFTEKKTPFNKEAHRGIGEVVLK